MLTPALAAGVTASGEVAGVSACVVVVTRAVAVVSEASSRSPSVAAAPSTPTMRIKATVGPARRAQRGQLRYVCHRFAHGLGLAKCAPSMGGPTASASVVSSGFGGCQRPLGACHQPGGGRPGATDSWHPSTSWRVRHSWLRSPAVPPRWRTQGAAGSERYRVRRTTLVNLCPGGRQGAAWWAELAI